MANETSKATRRRWIEDAEGKFPWRSLFIGRGIDIGAGDNPLPVDGCEAFDQPHGDANNLHLLRENNAYNYIHASQALEHMHRPMTLVDWMRLLKPGGYAIITVPSWELYEGMVWPSRYNPDHKSTWSMGLRGSPAGHNHVHVPAFLAEIERLFGHKTLLARQLDANYDYAVGTTMDQTWYEAHGVEPWIEFVLQAK